MSNKTRTATTLLPRLRLLCHKTPLLTPVYSLEQNHQHTNNKRERYAPSHTCIQHKNNPRTHTAFDDFICLHKDRWMDVYCANVSNPEQSNTVSEAGGEQKCMWRNVWFMSFEIFLRESDVHVASLNTLLYCAASWSSHEVPCRFIQTNYVHKKALTPL